MLEARAMPMMTALDMLESEGKVRSMGYSHVSIVFMIVIVSQLTSIIE
jgi:hypothetical protein